MLIGSDCLKIKHIYLNVMIKVMNGLLRYNDMKVMLSNAKCK